MYTDEQIEELLARSAKRLERQTQLPVMRAARPRVLPYGLAAAALVGVASFSVANRGQADRTELVVTASPPTSSPKPAAKVDKGTVADRKVPACTEKQIASIIEQTYFKTSGVRLSDVVTSRCIETFAILDSVSVGQWQRDLFSLVDTTWKPFSHVPTRPRPFTIRNAYGPLPSAPDFAQLQKLFGSDFFDVTDAIWKDVGEADGFKIFNQVLRKASDLQGFTLFGRDPKGRALVQMSGPPPKRGSVTADPIEPGRGDRWGLVSPNGSYQAITETEAFDMKSYKSEPSTFSAKINSRGEPTGKWGRLGYWQPAVDG
jgi:hypothetical protein